MAVKLGAISRLHAFPRAQDHLTQKTSTGAVVTILGLLTTIVLFIHELGFYLKPYSIHEMAVDNNRGQLLDISLNISFPGLPCQVLSLDALDMSGKHEVDIHTTIFKERLDRNGNRLGRELIRDLVEGEHIHDHKKQMEAAQTVQDVFVHMAEESEAEAKRIKKMIDEQEGCLVYGHLLVQRVAGNFHISVHGHSFFVLQQVFGTVSEVNVSHHIHRLGFGMEYPGQINPLDGFDRLLQPGTPEAGGTFKYFLKVVPTEYNHLFGNTQTTNQYSVTEYFTPAYKNDNNLPAVFFLYDLSPIMVRITEKRRNFFHFLTRLCAVVGGAFAVTGMVDRWVYHFAKQLTEPPSGRGLITPQR